MKQLTNSYTQNKGKYVTLHHFQNLKSKASNPVLQKNLKKTNTFININNLYYNICPAWCLSSLFDQNLTEKLTEAHWHNL
jgi:hypothetical protein